MMAMMLSPRDEKVLDFLVVCDVTKEFVEHVVAMVPEFYFYNSEIESEDLKSYRTDLNELLEEARNCEEDSKAWEVYDSLRKQYEEELADSVLLRRRLLVFGIMMQNDDKRREILFNLIQRNHMQKRVLKLKEVYRL